MNTTAKQIGGKKKIIMVCLASLPLVVMLLPWRLNSSPSLPVGFYRKHTEPSVQRGSIVAFCLPEETARLAKERRYTAFGFFCPEWTQLLMKPVAAVEGDTVEIRPEGVSINGVLVSNTKVFPFDSQGRPQERRLGIHRVQPGYVFVLAPHHERSWDSRYWGDVPVASITESMEEAFVWTK